MFRLGVMQVRPRFGRVAANCGRVVAALSEVEADLVVLPELPFTGYLFRDRAEALALAESPKKSPVVEALVALCRKQGFQLVTGFAERARDRVFNSALLIDGHGIRRTLRKVHLFNEEKQWFDPGDQPFRVDPVNGVRVGMMICLDWVFPEVSRTLALAGADILAHPSNLVLPHGQRAMRTRCLENGVFAATANRCGTDRRPFGKTRFTGRSQIIGPRGEPIFRAPAGGEHVWIEAVDPARARDKWLTPFNHLLRDRRPAFYRQK